jgi:hypothetical protein
MKKNEKRWYVLKAIESIFDGLELDRYDDGEPIMIELLDKDSQSLSKNWLSNDGWWISSASETINQFDTVDIQHYCWNRADEILHKVRFVRIYWRNRTESAEGEFYNHETGRTYAIFDLTKGGEFKSTRYANTWHDDSINWKTRYENRRHSTGGSWDELGLEEKVEFINSCGKRLDYYTSRKDDYDDDYDYYEDDDYEYDEDDDYDED